MLRFTTLFICCVLICSCNQNNCQKSEWQLVYKNDAEGKTVHGNKSVLIDAARMGYPIRIGFGGRRPLDTLKSIEHIADAAFISIANGNEVFGQINEFFGQKPDLDSDTISIKLKHENKWTLLIGTNGERSTLSRYFDSNIVQESKQGNRGASWFVKMPQNFNREKAEPIWN